MIILSIRSKKEKLYIMFRKERFQRPNISFLVDKCVGKGVTLYMKICKLWPEIVGEKIFNNSMPSFIARNKLYVNVSSAPWKNELEFLKNNVLIKINEKIKPYFIREIHFKIGSIDKIGSNSTSRTLPKSVSKKNLELIEDTSHGIKDQALKDIFKNAMLRSYNKKKENA